MFAEKHEKFVFPLKTLDEFNMFLDDLDHDVNDIASDLVCKKMTDILLIFINHVYKILEKSLVFNYSFFYKIWC